LIPAHVICNIQCNKKHHMSVLYVPTLVLVLVRNCFEPSLYSPSPSNSSTVIACIVHCSRCYTVQRQCTVVAKFNTHFHNSSCATSITVQYCTVQCTSLRATKVVHRGKKRDRNFYAIKARRMRCELNFRAPVDNFRLRGGKYCSSLLYSRDLIGSEAIIH
jgi:hypothetical protein